MRTVLMCFAGLVLLTGLGGCKKGEDDPLISLRTRKARVEGKWRLTGGHATITTVDFKNWQRMNEMITFKAGLYEAAVTGDVKPAIYKGIYSVRLDFKKDGNFSLIDQFDTEQLSARGNWDFTSGVGKDNKKKEGMLLMLQELRVGGDKFHFFSRGSMSFRYRIKELRSRKMVLVTESLLGGDGTDLESRMQAEFIFEQD